MSIEEFCAKHGACHDGREWALAHCTTMREAWDTAPDPSWVVWIATQPGVMTDRDLRLFACWSVRQVWHLLTDERSRYAVEVAERYAERYAVGDASIDELAAAWDAARAAAWAAEWNAAGTAAVAAAGTAAWAAEWNAAGTAARTAAWDAAGDESWAAARTAAWDAAWDAARAVQATYLREHITPNFE